MDVTDDGEGPLDPRIQVELENLNSATDTINKLEIELDEANTAFKQLHSECTSRWKEMKNKIGPGWIEKARCYYEASEVARQAQIQCQHQAHQFHRASEFHAAAKETVALAEARFISHRHEWNFDQAWQDMLNHATIKVMDAENKKAECAREHQRRAMLLHDAEKKAQQLEEKHRRAIEKAGPYFELRTQGLQKMAAQKDKIEWLQKAVKEAKRAYSNSFRALEEISNEIHQSRRDYDMMVNGPREPGVGAELISPDGSLNYESELSKVSVSRMDSLVSSEPDTEERDQDFQDVLELKHRMANLGGRSVDGSESTSSQWELELQTSMEKLNTLSLKNADWNVPRTTTNVQSPLHINRPSENNFQSNSNMNIDENQSKTLPIASTNSNNINNNSQGWQSLSQSPINSILNRSKIAIRNSLSKSLSNSPVNIGFNFSKTNLIHKNPGNSPQTNIESSLINKLNNSIPGNSSERSNFNVENVSMQKNQKDLTERDNNHHDDDSVPSDDLLNENKMTFSAESSPMKMKNNFVKNPIFQKANCKVSSVKELPLLSIFERPQNSQISKDKSCSMINLAEKRNLKTLLDNSALGNIQAVSIERLANARSNLMAEHGDGRVDSCK